MRGWIQPEVSVVTDKGGPWPLLAGLPGWQIVAPGGHPRARRVFRYQAEKGFDVGRVEQRLPAPPVAGSLAVVTLFAGRRTSLPGWIEFLLGAELAPQTTLYLVDNSGQEEFHTILKGAAARLGEARPELKLRILQWGKPHPCRPGESYVEPGKHHHVAGLYRQLWPMLEEDLWLTLEDDVVPPLSAYTTLAAELRGPVGVVCAAYGDPYRPGPWVCAADQRFRKLTWNQAGSEIRPVAYVGGGCSLWSASAVRNLVPSCTQEGSLMGWDWNLCRDLRGIGWSVLLHGGVRCQHGVPAGGLAQQAEVTHQPE